MDKPLKNNLELINAARTGNDQAFAALINQHRRLVFGTVWAVFQDFDDAEDATQETFISAYRHLNGLKDPNKFSSWLYTIARNVANKTIRKRQLQTRGLSRFKELSDPLEQEPPQTLLNNQTGFSNTFPTRPHGHNTVLPCRLRPRGGWGVYYAWRVMEKHDGKIEWVNRPEGGTRVTLTFNHTHLVDLHPLAHLVGDDIAQTALRLKNIISTGLYDIPDMDSADVFALEVSRVRSQFKDGHYAGYAVPLDDDF